MDSEQSAESAGINKHKKFMFIGNKKRYIEVLQCSGEDMNLVLTNGVQMPSSSSILPTMAPPAAATPQILPAQRPLISPGGTMVPTVPPAAAAPAPYGAGGMGAVIPYGQMAQMAAAYQPSSLLAVSQASQMAGALLPPTMTHIQPRPAVHPTSPAYQPILYWYPSPPVSPQSTYYVHASPTTVILKGLPPHASLTDILAFLEGVYEVIQSKCYGYCFTNELKANGNVILNISRSSIYLGPLAPISFLRIAWFRLVYITRFRITFPDAARRTVAEGPGWTSRGRSLHHVRFAGGSGEGRDGTQP